MRTTLLVSIILLIGLAIAAHFGRSSSSKPATSDTLCLTNRMIELEHANSTIECAVLLDEDLIFPRNIATNGEVIWLVDKGSNLFQNGARNGAIYRYQLKPKGVAKTKLLSGLDDPSDIDLRADIEGNDWVYFTTRYAVKRFKASSTSPTQIETVLDNLPTHGWHKLLAIHVSPRFLYLTVPSLTDHCEVDGISALVEYPCSEEQYSTATIRRYEFDQDTLKPDYEVVAEGLRDALAVVSNPAETHLILADNGWDQVDLSDTNLKYEDVPHDEINILDLSQSQHFAWPYCYDEASITPPYQRFIDNCDPYLKPWALLPPHSAPLAMAYFNDRLLINLHGNNDKGATTLAYSLDHQGLPNSGTPTTLVKWPMINKARARPLGLTKLSDKQLLVSDDWNHQLILISFKQPRINSH